MNGLLSSQNKYLPGFGKLILLMFMLAEHAAATPDQQSFQAKGAGTVLTRKGPCPDLPCEGNGVCSCVGGTGHLNMYEASRRSSVPASFRIEVNAENSTPTKDLGCDCFVAGGYLVITTRHGTVTVPFSGLAHRLRVGGGDGSGLFQIGAETAESFGTGNYKDSHGAGTISALFDEPGVRVVLDVGG